MDWAGQLVPGVIYSCLLAPTQGGEKTQEFRQDTTVSHQSSYVHTNKNTYICFNATCRHLRPIHNILWTILQYNKENMGISYFLVHLKKLVPNFFRLLSTLVASIESMRCPAQTKTCLQKCRYPRVGEEAQGRPVLCVAVPFVCWPLTGVIPAQKDRLWMDR